jgi:hypothetical protein
MQKDRRTDGRRDMTKLIFSLRNFSNAPKTKKRGKCNKSITRPQTLVPLTDRTKAHENSLTNEFLGIPSFSYGCILTTAEVNHYQLS